MPNDTTYVIKVQARNDFHLEGHEWVRLSRQGQYYAEVVYMERPVKCHIRKISKNEYVVLSTNEVRQFNSQKVKGKGEVTLRQTFSRLRSLIRCNFDGIGLNQAMITLEYKTNMRNPQTLQDDFDVFWHRYKRAMKGHKLEYIAIAEPQRRGAWHMHVLVKTDMPDIWLDKAKLKKLWGKGEVSPTGIIKGDAHVDYLRDKRGNNGEPVNDFGAYFVAYFTDLLGSNVNEESELETNGSSNARSKARQKGERLKMYPKNMKFYRCSQGITKPKESYKRYADVVSEYGNPIHQRSYDIDKFTEEDENNHLNTIHRVSFNKRKNVKRNLINGSISLSEADVIKLRKLFKSSLEQIKID